MTSSIIEADIYQGFSGEWLTRGGEHYVAKTSAEAFVQHINSLGVSLLGIEGFVLHHNTTMSVMNTIADYSCGGDSTAPVAPDVINHYLDTTSHLVTHFCFVLDMP